MPWLLLSSPAAAESDSESLYSGLPIFLNGDLNGDRSRDVSDAIHLFSYLFLGGSASVEIPCAVAEGVVRNGDVDGNGAIELTDGISLLRWIFLGGEEPALACSAVIWSGEGSGGSAHKVFIIDTSNPTHRIYTDPNTGKVITLGGFSGLVPLPGDPSNQIFYAITDRGPSVDFPPPPAEATGKAFADPGFSPKIITILLTRSGRGQILRVLDLKKPDGAPLTGIPSSCNTAEDPIVDLKGNPVEPRDPDGADTESLAFVLGGSFWFSDEYLPSVGHVTPDGTVDLRLVPVGNPCPGVIPALEVIPKVYRKRRPNRGFEGVTVTPGGKLYTILQRPLSNPTRSAGDNSRNIRLLEVDVETVLGGGPGGIRQLLYITEPLPPGATFRLRDIFASDLFALSDTELLVSERRTDTVFKIDLSAATDITPFEDVEGLLLAPVGTKTTIEQLTLAELAGLGIQPVSKTVVFSGLTGLDPVLDKVEGMCMAGGNLVVCHDNDFDIAAGDFSTTPATLIFQSPPNLSKIFTVPLQLDEDED
ncbi:MAG: esterase-like activity of phytase family protein [Planctomycetes bacterium]|nr:esterase-like activity of phytase family protein [Planctomycetota bacterium]